MHAYYPMAAVPVLSCRSGGSVRRLLPGIPDFGLDFDPLFSCFLGTAFQSQHEHQRCTEPRAFSVIYNLNHRSPSHIIPHSPVSPLSSPGPSLPLSPPSTPLSPSALRSPLSALRSPLSDLRSTILTCTQLPPVRVGQNGCCFGFEARCWSSVAPRCKGPWLCRACDCTVRLCCATCACAAWRDYAGPRSPRSLRSGAKDRSSPAQQRIKT